MKKNIAIIASFVALIFLSTALFQSTVLAASLTARMPIAKPKHTQITPYVQKDHFILKFREGLMIRFRNNQNTALDGTDLSFMHSLLNGLTVKRAFSRSEEELDHDKTSGEKRSGKQLADLNLYYIVQLNPSMADAEIERLLDTLNALDIVEIAYLDPIPVLAATPDWESQLPHFGPAPNGNNAYYTLLQDMQGQGMRFIDIENGWNTAHEDLKAPFWINGVWDTNNFGNVQHGAAVLGEIIAQPNGFGVQGIAPQASYGISLMSWNGWTIPTVASRLTPGDVINIEVGFLATPPPGATCSCNCGQQFGMVPVENSPAIFDAISQATANGIVVVEGAGNGSVNLDDPYYNGWYSRAHDSGAIMVGASEVVINGQNNNLENTRTPACFSNYGSRLDLNGWGNAVVTTGYGDLYNNNNGQPLSNENDDQYYTANFAGTSSATPMVTGSVLVVQGYKKQLSAGRVFCPEEIRSLLTSTGTSQLSGGNIGPMPNLQAAITVVVARTASCVSPINPVPTIISFNPVAGAVGSTVTLSGTGFIGAGAVSFNNTSASFTVLSDSQIQATIPSGATTGPIAVATPNGTATSSQTFTVYPPPTISSFTPISGPVGAGVTIAGANFTGATAVKFNGTSAQFQVISATQINTTVPASATTGPVTVTTPNGTATSAQTFTVYPPPTITYYSPLSALPGALVNVYGSNFCGNPCNAAQTQVKLNGVSITATFVSATNIQFTLPAGSTSGYLTVTTPFGTGSVYFIVQGVPQIIYFGPFIATTGTIVTIQGFNFCGVPCFVSQTQVKLNGLLLPITGILPGYLTVQIPAGATSGYLTVTTPAGTASSSSQLIIQQPPTISSFTPTSGPVGTLVDMSGFPFCAFPCDASQIRVSLNGAPVPLRAALPGYLRLEIPPGATTGRFTVTTAVGSATSAGTFTVTP